jgi:hypothetical protein
MASPCNAVWSRRCGAAIRIDDRIAVSIVVDVKHVDCRHKRTHTTVEIADALLWGASRQDTPP